MLYEFCASHGVPHKKCGKLVVATSEPEIEKLSAILKQSQINGVEGCELIDGAAAKRLEPELSCLAAMRSPETGVVDSHRYMLALQGDLEDHGGMIAFNTRIDRITQVQGGWLLQAGDDTITVDAVVNAAGLGAQRLGGATEGYPQERVPRLFLGKGSYFGYAGRPVFSRLIYPAPIHGGLGVHVTLDLAGRMRFGPDVEWTEEENYDVDPRRADVFYASIRKYFPAPAGRRAGAGLCRHPAEADGRERSGGGFHDRRAGAARRAAAGQSVRHRVAGADLGAVAGRGGRRDLGDSMLAATRTRAAASLAAGPARAAWPARAWPC